MTIYTIGFTKKSANKFFNLIKQNHVKKIIDVRLNNVSQLAGFAKRDDLKFFLREICNCDYEPVPDLAPTDEILKPYKKGDIPWDTYKDLFLNLMAQRNIEKHISLQQFENECLLCSEDLPHQCHRRLVIEYLQQYAEQNHVIKDIF
ncbi:MULTISPECIES: DUF488 family protein [Acinetobacter calcoaceticus/baumannii complex]|uniref:DUF488 domain-containing protein n=1 Tax=Acinetobacter calcoaceticus/baumannii complex TaxID=909768 RepID=UPI00029E3F72|nr:MULTISPECIES: DUF488 domain-containing protein [Acinetobacter calcoaceticus/baumannii complex]EKU57301.1 PF04343 family protein [Acinetobacter baumannii WC-348]MCU4593203.1 DUF488 domain-containing protein [Acinetobacter nosocomialis]